MKSLETERLKLRPFGPGDMGEAHRLLYADPEVAVAWAARTRTLDEIRASFAAKVAQADADLGFMAIVLKADHTLIGTLALQRYLPGDDTSYIILESDPDYRVGSNPAFIEAELTYALGRAYWGQGLAAEAGQALLDHGFKNLGVGRIINSVNSQNTRSLKLMHRLGFRLEANLNPKPFGDQEGPGVIGILENLQLHPPPPVP
jgi:ribosomal-protein-alanine N-acetyltransferase